MNAGSTIPRATYRMQFHRGFTLRDGLACVPYLSALGVSHLYASPLLMARPGSTHGYDVCQPARLNPELGTEADLDALVGALRERGMGLVLDVVPNHQGIGGPENPGWWDVLKHGRESRFASHFDIDWDSPDPRWRHKVLLPVLGDELERVLDRRELTVVSEAGEVRLRYFDRQFPVNPASLPGSGTPPDHVPTAIRDDPRVMEELLARQHYAMAHWRQGDRHLNYRRFFTITDLAGVCVENPQVFADTHQRILDWHRRGLLDGLRIDHPDGLRDPRTYLERLSRAAPGAWITVEKILEPGEELPGEWPVAGTTGYDFLGRLTGLFVDPAGEKPLTDFYATFTGEHTPFAALVHEKKLWILQERLAAEVARLTRLLEVVAAGDARSAVFTTTQLRAALIELAACVPVYRTYIRADHPVDHGSATETPAAPAEAIREADVAVVRAAVADAQRGRPDLEPVFAFLRDLLLGGVRRSESAEWVMRFQQLTGPAMAKGVEDTAFYCYHRFVALNEVGGDPGRFSLSVPGFHQASDQAGRHWPHAMLATSTHDTKRSEDVRARLALLSEIPGRWAETVRRWSALNEPHRQGGWPDRNAEYLFYQTLVGAWPLPVDRALAYMEKAVREAGQHTNWTERNAEYEAALGHFVSRTLADAGFVEDLERFVTPLIGAGQLNALAQTLLKLTSPGVPDLYQGADLWDLSLVDPDNRRPVDFARRREALGAIQRRIEDNGLLVTAGDLLADPADGRVKLFVILRTLMLRHRQERVFREGQYVPLGLTGGRAGHACAFARVLGGKTVIVIVPRLVLGLAGGRGCRTVGAEVWTDTALTLSAADAGRTFRNVFTGEDVVARREDDQASLGLAELFARFPLALCEAVDSPPPG